MSGFKNAHKSLVSRILEGNGIASRKARRNAFENSGFEEPARTLVNGVAKHASSLNDLDFTVVRVSGLSEDEIFELVTCAAIGQATRQYNTAMAALDSAIGKD